jgi:hypothetical protein
MDVDRSIVNHYPLVNVYITMGQITMFNWKFHYFYGSSLLNMAIEIVKFPIEHGDLAHSYVNVYQRVMVDNGTINIH